jgi:hypothetical protein
VLQPALFTTRLVSPATTVAAGAQSLATAAFGVMHWCTKMPQAATAPCTQVSSQPISQQSGLAAHTAVQQAASSQPGVACTTPQPPVAGQPAPAGVKVSSMEAAPNSTPFQPPTRT